MKTILVIEDDQSVRNNLEIILDSNGFCVCSAKDGLEGFRMLSEITPDLIISDIMMPGIDGLELLGKIRNGRLHSSVPFIILTAKSTYEELREGMAMGADDYLFKPFTIKDLLESVNTVLEKNEKHEGRLKELRDNIALTVPHEFRTPLTAILGYSEILKEDIARTIEDTEIKEIVNNLSDSVKRFNRLVQKFTNYTNVVLMMDDESTLKGVRERRVSSAKLTLHTSALKIAEHYKRLSDLDIRVQDAELSIDETYLSFMVEELVNNAMRYSRCGQRVSLRGNCSKGRYEIKVRDEGIGMSPEQIREIAAFRQFSRDALMGKSGNGIGLVTVKKIAEHTGLEFNIRSEVEQFTEVTITVPCMNVQKELES
ncbi:MAG: hybrid sensor histidine kinase/response regulator [Ignavibacteria bacterium]|jgi:signal transduction histidine kinase|nr:hybrid sensor histidine kinase/response regulator [Ignavibacteria bacterium]MCU7505258.1 hybrid sensor histidine kinase/response regulator [Ignavibacteria bacterium]MCU7518506.1 hybrid sensor histidine kinase/response regulator [Ignavibacteria bacterium]